MYICINNKILLKQMYFLLNDDSDFKFNTYLLFAERFKCLAFSLEGWPCRDSNRAIEERRKGRRCDEKGKHRAAHSFVG